MSDPKCLRCGAGAEWLQGRVPDEPAAFLVSKEPDEWMANCTFLYIGARYVCDCVTIEGVLDVIASHKIAIASLQRKLEEAERATEQEVSNRDDAEQAISQAYFIVTGHSPEWSNNFGYQHAGQDIEDACSLLKQTIASQHDVITELRQTIIRYGYHASKDCLQDLPEGKQCSACCSALALSSPVPTEAGATISEQASKIRKRIGCKGGIMAEGAHLL